jgi:hypothetical protein
MDQLWQLSPTALLDEDPVEDMGLPPCVIRILSAVHCYRRDNSIELFTATNPSVVPSCTSIYYWSGRDHLLLASDGPADTWRHGQLPTKKRRFRAVSKASSFEPASSTPISVLHNYYKSEVQVRIGTRRKLYTNRVSRWES